MARGRIHLLAGLGVLLCALSLRAQGGAIPPGKPAPAKRVLVYTLSAGYEHEVVKRGRPDGLSLVETALVELGSRTGHFEAVPSRSASSFDPESLAKFDLVFFYTTGELPLSEAQRRALLDFVKQGGAFAGAHCATDTFYEVPEYGGMVGAHFDGHPWHQEIRVRVEDPAHPATAHLGPAFAVVDEICQFRAPYDRKTLHVLLSVDTASVDLKAEAVRRQDGDFALAWCKDYDKGRVFYTALGHEPALWKDERFLAHLDGGFRWAMRMTPDAPSGEARSRANGAREGARGEEKKEDKQPPGRALPIVPEGFAIDLVAEAPEILWPSANACLPDGSLCVGEDRMDMPGPTDQPVDRVIRLRWRPDGGYEKTVFAEQLFAVMGMAEVDGDLYVMNMPRLTRLADRDGDGVAEERQEILTDLGPKAPGAPGTSGGFNDHIVSGIRLGMDGFLYVAVGDKGIPGAHGTDGSTIELRGGGVVRVRPDGSGLEVVATGLRNVLDVAIDERGEMFTYDNTDDGLGWWTRLSHVVVGGSYGYPWDYQEHPERMLPCMAEYGGGSPTGGLVYREAAWPEECQGNLFFCEWGRGALRRFVLEPDGATFRVALAEDFVKAGDVPAFKPLDVCESPDGRFLYISDWGYEGWTNPKEAGRLWRLRRAGDDPAGPSAAKPLPEDVGGLVEALGDPSFQHRLRAQRELVRRGDSAKGRLRSHLAAAETKRRKTRHALWALAAIDRRDLDRFAPEMQNRGADARQQLARAIGEGERSLEFDVVDLVADPSPLVRREAATSIGSVYRRNRADLERDREGFERDGKQPRNAGGVAPRANARASILVKALAREDDPFVRWAIRGALRELPVPDEVRRPGPEAWLWDAYLPVLRGRFREDSVASLAFLVGKGVQPELVSRAIEILGGLHRKPEPWDGEWWGIQPAKSPPPRHVVEWERTAEVAGLVRSSFGDRHREVRRAALEAIRVMGDRGALPSIRALWKGESDDDNRALILDLLGELRDEDATELLGSIVKDAGVGEELRQRAIDAAGAIRTPRMVELLAGVAANPRSPAAHVVPCLHALGRLKDPGTAPVVVRRLEDDDEAIRIAAASAIVDIEGVAAAARLEPLLRDPSVGVRLAVLGAFGRLKLPDAAPKLLPLVDDEETRDDAIQALAAAPVPRALPAYLLGLGRKSRSVQEASRLGLSAVRDAVRGALEAKCGRGEIGDVELAALQSIYRDPQPILEWSLSDAFPRPKEPKLPDPAEPRHWIAHRAEPKDGFVDLERLLSKKSEVGAYAVAEVRSAAAREAELTLGSDDSIALFVNGELVHEFEGNRSWKADEDRIRVPLRAGTNAIVLLVGNATGGWSFNAKVSGDATGPLFERKAERPELEAYRRFVLENRGDPARGFEIFRASGDGAMCIRCHRVFGAGDPVGPELSDVGAKYGREEILDSILAPSRRIAEGYRSSSIELRDGRVIFGMIQKETRESVELFDTNGQRIEIEKADVASRRELDTSVMPDGLWATLAEQDLADLVEWLTKLRGAPRPR